MCPGYEAVSPKSVLLTTHYASPLYALIAPCIETDGIDVDFSHTALGEIANYNDCRNKLQGANLWAGKRQSRGSDLIRHAVL